MNNKPYLYTVLCKVRWVDDMELVNENIILYAADTIDVAKQLDDLYGKDLDAFSVEFLDNWPLKITDDTYNTILHGDLWDTII